MIIVSAGDEHAEGASRIVCIARNTRAAMKYDNEIHFAFAGV